MKEIVMPKRKANGRLNLVGKRYGSVTVIEYSGSELVGNCSVTLKKKYKSVFKYKCDCGNIGITRGATLVDGKITSCGCEKIKRFSKLGSSKRKHVHSGFSFLWNSYKSAAKKRNLDFCLSKDQFQDLTSSDCFYCGSTPAHKRKTRFKHAVYSYVFNGIDRINNNLGYSKENCVSCCEFCNKMKMSHDPFVFLEKCKKIALMSFSTKSILKYRLLNLK